MNKEGKIVFCTGGGCTAKLGAGVLSHILEKLDVNRRSEAKTAARRLKLIPEDV